MAVSDYTRFIAALHARAFSDAERILDDFPYFINASHEVCPDQYTLPQFSRSHRLDVFQWLLDRDADPHFTSLSALSPPLEVILTKEDSADCLDVLVDHFGLDVLRCTADVDESPSDPIGSNKKPSRSGALIDLMTRPGLLLTRLGLLAHVLKKYPSLLFDAGPKAYFLDEEQKMAPPHHWLALATRMARFPDAPAERTQMVTLLSSVIAAHEARQVVEGLVSARAHAP